MARLLTERVAAMLALLLTGVALFASTLGHEFSDVGGAHSPVFFPRIVLALWIGLAALALADAVRQAEVSTPIASFGRLAVVVLGGVAYVNLITTAGFFLASVGFSAVALIAFGLRNPIAIGLYAVAAPGALTGLFNHVLAMPLPTSPFTHFF